MKTYILENIQSIDIAINELNKHCELSEKTWLFKNDAGDVMAYFTISHDNDPEIRFPSIISDVSGRHYDCDEMIISLLKCFQGKVGGEIIYSP